MKAFLLTLIAVTGLLPPMCAADENAALSHGHVEWPTEWIVFAPFDRGDPVPEATLLRSIPDSISVPASDRLPARTVTPRRIKVNPGTTHDLSPCFPEQRIGNVAYIFLELSSTDDQVVTLGMGADWWMQAWMNGELVFDTVKNGDKGNVKSPIEMLNHTVDVSLRAGTNLLAVRFITGKASANLALGGPAQFAGAAARIQARQRTFPYNHPPRDFAARQVFPVDEQALIMARCGLALPQTTVDLSAGGLAGVQAMPPRQLRVGPIKKGFGWHVYDDVAPRFRAPVTILLSKSRYPWEDRHLDAVVWLSSPNRGPVTGALDLSLTTSNGISLAHHTLTNLSPNGHFFSLGFPPELRGKHALLEATWRSGEQVLGRTQALFHVRAPAAIATSGRVPLRILNGPGATVAHAPMTVGVPFPRGALDSPAHVRLVDERGDEIPMQARETARWSRFGPVKWLLCSFTVDLEGTSREVFLDYGPDMRRHERTDIPITAAAGGFPVLDAGRLRSDRDGIHFDADGTGVFRPVLAPGAFHGAFVRHEDGTVYTMSPDAEYNVEESGPEHVVVRHTGWYTSTTAHPASNRFCQFVTRFVLHRNSPVIRIFHTWIFTGDGNRDRIAHMGWQFPSASPLAEGRMLTAFDKGQWLDVPSLVQFDDNRFVLPDTAAEHAGRTPGVLTATIGDTRVLFGARDFWQNFPSELDVGANGFTFYNWPKRNPAARSKRPVEVGHAYRIRFAHEGEVLDFRLPDEYVTGPISTIATRSGSYPLWEEGRPESVNAQGIARTEEMWLYFAGGKTDPNDAARVLRGLNDETLRAVVDPAWMCASGVFGDLHPSDPERYPEEETIYTAGSHAPERWVECLPFYGMWAHGDIPFFSVNLEAGTAGAYRTLLKNYQWGPCRMLPFARTGDPAFLKLARNAVRQMTDVNFCHYASAEVDAAVGPGFMRRQGWWDKPAVVPWVGYNDSWANARIGSTNLRTLNGDCDYLWDAWHMTGYARARDVALLYGELTKHDYATLIGPRTTMTLLPAYLDMYRATFDPWFLVAAHRIAELHRLIYGGVGRADKRTFWPDTAGHTWRPADQVFYEFTGDKAHREIALNNAIAWSSLRGVGSRNANTLGRGGAHLDQAAFAWRETGDDFYLARIAAVLDRTRLLFNTDTNHCGYGRGPGSTLTCAGADVPRLLALRERAGALPEPCHDPFLVRGESSASDDGTYAFRMRPTLLRKSPGQPVTIFLDALRGRRADDAPCPAPPLPAYRYRLTGPRGVTYREDTWRAPQRIDLPADAPPGVYRVDSSGALPIPADGDRRAFIRRHGVMFYPLSTENQPEVMVFEKDPSKNGTRVTAPLVGFWFHVPATTKDFWIEFAQGNAPRWSVWTPDGSLAWDRPGTATPIRITIQVPPQHAGKLWRATGGDFVMDPQIPPYFAARRAKWFNPEE